MDNIWSNSGGFNNRIAIMNPRIRNKSFKFGTLEDVERYANSLLKIIWKFKSGHSVQLSSNGFTFEWDKRSKKRLGYCNYTYTTIGLSQSIIELNLLNSNEIRAVILHELAHAITFVLYGETGHTKNWKEILIYIGGDGKVRYDARKLKMPVLKYTLKCTNCGSELPYTKEPVRDHACSYCCKGAYDEKYKMEVIKNI